MSIPHFRDPNVVLNVRKDRIELLIFGCCMMMRFKTSTFHPSRLAANSSSTSATAEFIFARIPRSFQKHACISHYPLILLAIQNHGHACPQVAFSSIDVQLRVTHHIHHDVDALLLPQLRHADTIPHLAKGLACLHIGVLAIHVMIEISV